MSSHFPDCSFAADRNIQLSLASTLTPFNVTAQSAAALSTERAAGPDVSVIIIGVFVAVLVTLATVTIISSAFRMRRFGQLIREFVTSLSELGVLESESKRRGRLASSLESWRMKCQKFQPAAKLLASDLEHALVVVKDDDGHERVFLRDTASTPWDERATVARFVNVGLVSAAPGLLTAIGLVGTFSAIAYGMSELRPAEGGMIEGVGPLITGLRYKFFSSIIAISLAVAVQLYELIILAPGTSSRFRKLRDAVEDAFPRISPAQQSAHMLETLRTQERALSNISSDMVTAFSSLFTSSLLPDLGNVLARSVQAEVGPSLGRLDDSLKALNEGIQRLESGKQESIGAELRALTSSLERALTDSLTQMGKEFRAALSGSAGSEFDNASEALRTSADVLTGMNASFANMQATLNRLLQESERRAETAFSEGEGRTRALNDLVERLVTQLNESASTSASEVQRLLVDAVAGMGARLTQVTNELEDRVLAASQQSISNNERFVTEVTGAVGRTSAETERLLASLAERSGDFIAAADQLRELRDGVASILAQTGDKVREINEAAGAFRAVATQASSMTLSLRETQDQQRQTTETASKTVVRVSDIVDRQSELVDASGKTFTQAKEVFAELDVRLASALKVLVEQMQDYNMQVEKNFEAIISRVNQKLPELFDRLEGSLQQVAEVVEDLTETVEKQRNSKV